MLTWVGKRRLTQVTAYPAQHVERPYKAPEAERTAHALFPAMALSSLSVVSRGLTSAQVMPVQHVPSPTQVGHR
jgi:hypothetical protein